MQILVAANPPGHLDLFCLDRHLPKLRVFRFVVQAIHQNGHAIDSHFLCDLAVLAEAREHTMLFDVLKGKLMLEFPLINLDICNFEKPVLVF